MLPINFECFVASAACLIIVPRAADGAVNYEALGQRRPLCICAFVLMKITMCFSGCPEPHVSRIYRVCLYTRQYGMKTHHKTSTSFYSSLISTVIKLVSGTE